MILQDIWTLMNDIIRGNEYADISRKQRAVYEGYKELSKRLVVLNKGTGYLLETKDFDCEYKTNRFQLPDNFLFIKEAWWTDGATYVPFDNALDLNALQEYSGISFNDTTNLGTPLVFAIEEPYAYFDRHFPYYDTITLTTPTGTFTVGETISGGTSLATAIVSADVDGVLTVESIEGDFVIGEIVTGGASGFTGTISSLALAGYVRLNYYTLPAETIAYDRIYVTNIVGTFVAGEELTGGTSSTSATIYAVGDTYIDVYSASRVQDTYDASEALSGSSSSATAVFSSMTQKPQEIEVGETYRMILAEASAMVYQFFRGDIHASVLEQNLDDLIKAQVSINDNKAITFLQLESY